MSLVSKQSFLSLFGMDFSSVPGTGYIPVANRSSLTAVLLLENTLWFQNLMFPTVAAIQKMLQRTANSFQAGLEPARQE